MQISRVVTFIMHENTKSQISIDFEKAMPVIVNLVENHKWQSTTEKVVKIFLTVVSLFIFAVEEVKYFLTI